MAARRFAERSATVAAVGVYTRSMLLPASVLELSAGLLGLFFGSFLNVCIARLPRHESIVSPRSRCPHCGHAIRWYDNLPVLSWLLLRARCRDCRELIATQYPLVELATGLWFGLGAGLTAARLSSLPAGAGYQYWGDAIVATLSFTALGFFLIGLMVMDWQTGLLPNAFTFSGLATAFFLIFARCIFLGTTEGQIILTGHHLRLSSPGSFADQGNVFLTGPEAVILGRLAAVCGVALLLLAVRGAYKRIRHRDGMGLGDVKMLAMIAAFVGFWPAILCLFLGILTASFYAVFLILRRGADATTRLPFGTFLGLGGLLTAIFGDRILADYVKLFQ